MRFFSIMQQKRISPCFAAGHTGTDGRPCVFSSAPGCSVCLTACPRSSASLSFLQLVIFTLLLAALAHNQWSRFSGFGGWTAFGVAGTHDSAGNDNEYDCSNGNSDDKNYCRTIAAAGAFTLIFGLVGILAAAALLVLVVLSLLGQGALAQFNVHVPVLSNMQWICMQAMIMIWGSWPVGCNCG